MMEGENYLQKLPKDFLSFTFFTNKTTMYIIFKKEVAANRRLLTGGEHSKPQPAGWLLEHRRILSPTAIQWDQRGVLRLRFIPQN